MRFETKVMAALVIILAVLTRAMQSYGEWYRGILCARSILQSGPSVCQAST
jgi:ABC-type methionine transport system permease subunit